MARIHVLGPAQASLYACALSMSGVRVRSGRYLPKKRFGKSIGNGLGAPETALYFWGLVRGEARPVWRLLGGARRGAGLAGEESAGGASGRPVSGVDGAVRGFASFGGGAAPWPSGGEECSSCCPALLQAAWQAVSWRPVR